MKNLDIFIYFIIFIKICFIIFVLIHGYLKRTGKLNSELDKKAIYWKAKLEFIFKALMAVLIIYLFNPRFTRETIIDYETKVLLFLFGIILLITADWSAFFEESAWFIKLQTILGRTDEKTSN